MMMMGLGLALALAGIAATMWSRLLWRPVIRYRREAEAKAGRPRRQWWPFWENGWMADDYVAATGDSRRVRLSRAVGVAGLLMFVCGVQLVEGQLPDPRASAPSTVDGR